MGKAGAHASKWTFSEWIRKENEIMTEKDYQEIIRTLIELIPEGVYIVDEDGIGLFYNQAMARIEKIKVEDVIGKDLIKAFPGIEPARSTMYQAVKQGLSTRNKQQTYINLYGKEVTTQNSTVPVVSGGKTVGAIEVARDITDLRNMTDQIQQLREDAYTAPKRRDRAASKAPRYTFDDIVGRSELFDTAVQRAKKAARNDAPVFIYGETGTGKELFAQSIHAASQRSGQPFLAQNCAAIPETLLEGILFGTQRGGFTGAVDRAGLFEQASGGTLLLDEMSAMPYDLQSKLLRVLQDEHIRRVGGTKEIPIDVRIIATVNEDPELLIEQGKLRRDLYYRLNVFNISIPPLRNRQGDVQLLAEALLEKNNRKYGKELWMISDRAISKLDSYDYPGNVRELENIIVQSISMAENEHVLTDKMLQMPKRVDLMGKDLGNWKRGEPLMEYLADLEESVIRNTVSAKRGNITKSAEELGMSRQALQHKLKKYGMTTR